MKRIILFLMIAVLIAMPMIQAVSIPIPSEPPKREDYVVKSTDQPLHLILEEYTKTGIKVYENAIVLFEDTKGNKIDMLVTKVGKETKITFVRANDKTEEMILPVGEKAKEVRILGDEKLPSFFIESNIIRDLENDDNKYTILFVTVPIFSLWTPDKSIVSNNSSAPKDEKKSSNLQWYVLAIAVLLLVLIFLGPRKNKKKDKE